jgi:CRISPR-associated endonuclease/helicase Cas3
VPYLAHVTKSAGGEYIIHTLEEHLEAVAKMASRFSNEFGGDEWGYLAGKWHDLGKFSREFQDKIKRESGYDAEAHLESETDTRKRVDHSTAGAIHAIEKCGARGRILAYLIAGHHAGLPDWDMAETGPKALKARLEQRRLLERIPQQVVDSMQPRQSTPPGNIPGGPDGVALWVRMLFSCLVDADFLDTEAFMDEEKAGVRNGQRKLEELLAVFNNHMEDKERKSERSPVNRVRAEVLRQCREKAVSPSGIYSLTVPTGGGKTLSSLAFALEHAVSHGKRRIIYAIPYTSIIEQTADIFREVFNAFPEAVVEHHSNLESDKETTKSRLAAENWDAPLIVTTNVQLFESLFASRTSRCRKLHNIVNSVVILDEAQLLPPEFLQPILDTLNILAVHYRVTFVVSTATQPALNTAKDSFGKRKRRGLDNVTEIMSDVDALYDGLERVRIKIPDDFQKRADWDGLAGEISSHESVLAIVNTRADCRGLWRRMPEGTIHLSALMCGAHRSKVIKEIKERLKAGQPTRVISTQLVEAGVDIDFPVVYRAMAGLDSIAQAAGRCNREGKLDKGTVAVFVPPKPAPKGLLRFGEDATRDVWHGLAVNPLSRSLFTRYFDTFFGKIDLDKHKIADLLTTDAGELKVQFRTAAAKFKLIDDKDSQAVFVRYDEASSELLCLLRHEGPQRWLLRKLQRHTVNLYRHDFDRLLRDNEIEEIQPGMYALINDSQYDKRIGLLLEDSAAADPASLLV